MNTKGKCRIICILESLFSCILVTLLILKFSVIYSVAILFVGWAIGYLRKKMLPVFNMHEQIIWNTGSLSLFLILAYAIFQKTLLLVCAAICFVGCILEWKYNLFSKLH